MKDFYLTLPSNASMEIFPNNTLSEFYVKLPQTIDLSGQWEVGVSEVLIPKTYKNIQKSKDYAIILYHTLNVSVEFYLPEGYYKDAQSLVTAISETTNVEIFEMKFHPETGHIDIKLHPGVRVSFGKKLAQMLGFNGASTVALEKYMPKRQVDVHFHLNAMYIYTDIVEPTPVGDVLAPLLRVIPISGVHSTMSSFIFTSPHYYPVNRKSIDVIQTYITDDSGQIISFNSGRCVIVLHFKPL